MRHSLSSFDLIECSRINAFISLSYGAKVMIQASVGKLLRICIDKMRFGEAENDIFDAYKIVDFIFN